VTRDLGFRLNLMMVLYFENLCLIEKPRLFNPKPRVAPERWQTYYDETSENNIYLNTYSFCKL
ncbi:hypothetical protein AAEO57_20680, partial [Flavobacterium sp. DGU38]